MPQDFRFDSTIANPLTEVRVDGVSDYPRTACGCRARTLEEKIAHENSECSRVLAAASSPVRSHLKYVAGLLQIPRWMSGSWADAEGGWRHYRDNIPGEVLSFLEMEKLIAERIAELGLDRELIDAHAGSCGSEPGREFWRLPFDAQMQHFRKAK